MDQSRFFLNGRNYVRSARRRGHCFTLNLRVSLAKVTRIKLYRPRSLNPVVDQREELPLLPFGNPIGFVPAASRGVTQ